LTRCSESKAFKKQEKKQLKALQKRMDKYKPDSAAYRSYAESVTQTEKRFKAYADAGKLCGEDGLPHLVAEPGLAYKYGLLNDTVYPSVAFLYIAGFIGYTARLYLQTESSKSRKISIDTREATRCVGAAAAWPYAVVAEIRRRTLAKEDSEIYRSPR
jgi:photosystem I subunit 3